MKKTPEQQVAETILQKPETVVIGGEAYQVAPPSTATLILVSELTSQLPGIKLDTDNIVIESLYIAKDCRIVGDIVATLILGAKGLKGVKKVEKRRLFGIVRWVEEIEVDNRAALADKILQEVSPDELPNLFAKLLQQMRVSDFFAFTTSLIEVNLQRPTREVVKQTTAFGR